MDNPRIDTAAERLEPLERRVRVLSRALALTILGAVSLAALGAIPDEKPKEIDASRITLRDGDGKVRALFEVGKDGLPTLSFLDKDEKLRIYLGINEELGAGISLQDKEHQGGVYLSVSQGISSVDLQDHGGYRAELSVSHLPEPAAELTLGPIGKPNSSLRISSRPENSGITCLDKGGKATWLGVDDDGASQLIFTDQGEKERLILGRKADDSTFLKIQGRDGKELFHTP